MVGLEHYLTVAGALFVIGIFGLFLNRKNVIIILMSIELMLLAVNINLVAFSAYLGDLVGQILRVSPPYRFGEDEELFDRIFEASMANWSQATDLTFPSDVILIQRSLSGHFGNLTRLRAAGDWRELVTRYLHVD